MPEPEILFCDNHILVAEKPAGKATQPDFVEELRHWVRVRFKKPGKAFLEPIHRLDKPVSGLILCARTSKALERLNQQMQKRHIEKRYCAVLCGSLAKKRGKLTHFLLHKEFRAEVTHPSEEGAKEAELSYQILREENGYSFAQIWLATGRYHQIRAQLSAMGAPILGDLRYGGIPFIDHLGIALHHEQMCFIHPVSREELRFLSKKNAEMRPNMAIAEAKRLIWEKAV
jgi:23S rRNA pseudouridine1911/1915/1917 synthase